MVDAPESDAVESEAARQRQSGNLALMLSRPADGRVKRLGIESSHVRGLMVPGPSHNKAGLRQKRGLRLCWRSRNISRSFTMRLVQFRGRDGERAVAALAGDAQGQVVRGVT